MEFDWSVWLFGVVMIGVVIFLLKHIGINFSATSVLLSLTLLLHGPAYLYYTRVWGPQTEFFHHILSAAPGQPIIQTLDIALSIFYICICFGIKLSDCLFHKKGSDVRLAISGWGFASSGAFHAEKRRLLKLTIYSLLFLLPFVFVDNQLSKVVEYFTANLGEFEKIALRREGGGSKFYLYNLLMSFFFPFVAYSVIAAGVKGARYKLANTAIFIILLFVIALAKVAMLSKAPIVILLIQIMAVFCMSKSLTISLKNSVSISFVSIFGLVLMTIFANSDMTALSETLEFLFYRIFMIVNESLIEYFSAIPHVIDHTWHFLPSWIGGGEKLATYWLVAEVHRGVIGSTTTAMFLGDAWADFSWAGVVVLPIVMGLIVRTIDIKLILQRGCGLFTIAALALAHQGIFVAFNTSFQTSLFTGGLLFILPLVYIFSEKSAVEKLS